MSAPPATIPPLPSPSPSLAALRAALAVLLLTACAPLVRPATFVGARDQVTDATLVGPFDGQVTDAATGEPVDRATVIAIWSYDRGDGFIGPYGSESYETETDAAGRYRIPPAKLTIRGSTVRLVAFSLVIYKRGFVGYRSESTFEGEPRADFTVRHNRIALRKWRRGDSHARHLAYLAPPRTIQRLAAWETDRANLDLYRELGGDVPEAALPEEETEAGAKAPGDPKKPSTDTWLDAGVLLTPEEIRQRTRTQTRFSVGELTDLERTSFYHGVHFKAVDRDEAHDLALRVWEAPPGGIQPVIETIETTMAGAERSDTITSRTWALEAEGIYAVAFVEESEAIGILLTCGDMQCADLETALVLASELHRNLGRLKRAPIGARTAIDEVDPATAEEGEE